MPRLTTQSTPTGCPPWVDDLYREAALEAVAEITRRERELGDATRPKGLKALQGVNARNDGRYLADLRRWVKQGEGSRQPSIAKPGETRATTDLAYANEFYARLTRKLSVAQKRNGENGGGATPENPFRPVAYVETYLRAKVRRKARGKEVPVTEAQITAVAKHLQLIFTKTSFADIRDIRTIRRRDITRLAAELWEIPTVDGERAGPGTIRKRLHALSGMLSFAMDEDDIESNPVHGHPSVPGAGAEEEAEWLELEEVRTLLRALRTMRLHWKVRTAYYIACVMFYTGARLSEVMRMRPADAHPDMEYVLVRGSKTEGSRIRHVRYWHALREIMREYWAQFNPSGALLFPGLAVDAKAETTRGSIMGTLHRAAEMAGLYTRPVYKSELVPVGGRKKWRRVWVYQERVRTDGSKVRRRVVETPGKGKLIGHHTARHTYISIRLGMLRGGAPIDIGTVMRESGHDDERTVRSVYAHAMQRRHAFEELDYGSVEPTQRPLT
jgi:integrase